MNSPALGGFIAKSPRGMISWAFRPVTKDRVMNFRLTPAAMVAAENGDMDNFLAAATPGGIEAQEKAGQTMFVSNATLPKEMLGRCTRENLEQMGIKFGADADDLFVTAQLPAGWKKQATEHSMWSELLDEKGRKRGAIFYKAAFYDRKAHITLSCRYNPSTYEPCDADGNVAEYGKHTHMKTVVQDCGSEVHVVGVREDRDYVANDAHGAQAEAWLDEHYPDWRNPLAYWD